LPLVRKYNQLQKSKKKQDAFYTEHFDEFEDYKSAKKYLKSMMKGGKQLLVNEWEAEKKQLYSKRWMLCDKYYGLRGKTKSVERLKCSAEALFINAESKKLPQRIHDLEL
jgi:hypothetical protein